MVAVCFVVTVLACADLLLRQADVQRLAKVTVTITPTKVTLFAGETQRFVAAVVGTDNQPVNWSVEEQDGGDITDMGHYTAPKLQGVYHITIERIVAAYAALQLIPEDERVVFRQELENQLKTLNPFGPYPVSGRAWHSAKRGTAFSGQHPC